MKDGEGDLADILMVLYTTKLYIILVASFFWLNHMTINTGFRPCVEELI